MADARWLAEAGLGIFLHWGHASTRGWELSWQMLGGVEGQWPPRDPVPVDAYFDNAVNFDPTGFDPDAWATAVADAGARYAVFTTKHHDGFAMFDSTLADYSSRRTAPFGRDVVAELFPALRRAGLRVGVYFSIVDWHHPDYPRYSDATVRKPYVVGEYPRASPEQWERYRRFMLGQLEELLTRYGPVDVVWLDGEFEHTEAEWDFAAIRAVIRRLAPTAIVNDRCIGHGDFATPEQALPRQAPAVPWEMCMTLNDSWGYVPTDTAWKSPAFVIEQLVETVCAGGTMLLNVGPCGDGTWPPEAVSTTRALGRWIGRHRDAVDGVGPSKLDRWQVRLPSSGRELADGWRVFVYCTLLPNDTLVVRDIPVRRVRDVRMSGADQPLRWQVAPYLPDVRSGSSDPRGDLSIAVDLSAVDDICPVVVLDFTGQLA